MLPMTARSRCNARVTFLALVAALIGAGPALAQSSITIGQTAVLSAGDAQNGGLLLAQQATLSRAATVSSLSFYVTSAAGQLRLGLYDATGPNGGPGVLKAQTSGFKPVKGWNTVTAVSATALPAGSYWLAYLPSSNALSFVKQNNSGSCYYQSRSFGSGLPSTFSKTPQNCTPTTWSLYAVLTASGGASVSGACGSSNGAALKSAPATNLCAAGTASAVSGSGPWRWSCAGSNGGATAQCLASVAATAVNGVCGSANGVAVTSAPTSNLCTTGNASTVSGAGPWTWTCAGSNGGKAASCSAPRSSSALNGACGSANGSHDSTVPTAGLCSAGTTSAISGSGPWTWTCAGANGGTTSACVAYAGNNSPLPVANDASANWQMAGMQSVGGIPNRTTVCATVSPLGLGRDDSAKINNAISACPPGDVLALAAGTFTLAEGNYINVNKGITLRGAGPGNTIINMPKGAVLNTYSCGQANCVYSPSIVLGPPQWTVSWTPTTLTADAAQGDTSAQVANISGFAVGQWVLIDETSGAAWQKDPEGYGQVWAASDWLSSSSSPATGKVLWQKHNPSQGWDDFSSSEYPYQSGTTGCYYSFCDRPTSELHLIKAITRGSGTVGTITFDDPLTIAYRTGHKAQLYYPSGPFIQYAGVENMTVQGGDGGNVYFSFCANCWAKNVESKLWLNGGFVATYSARIEMNEIYSHECAWPVPGGGGYNIDLQNATTEIYVVNSISVECDKVITVRSGGAGSVVAYNYMDDQFIDGSEYWQEIGINGSHATGSHHVLFEGNYGSNLDSDHTHGNAIYHTFFRNYATGNRARFTDYISGVVVDDENNLPGGNGPLRAAGVMGYTYWTDFIGNVLGIPGDTTSAHGWAYNGSFSAGTPGIWLLGWNDQPPYTTDPNSTTYTYRDGNYDYYTNAVTWNSADTQHTLPSSLYLSSEPSFFTAGKGYTWPWVNPTGSKQLYTLPAKARYDAGTPFTQP